MVLMVLAVVGGTLFDVYHKRSGQFFALRRRKSKLAAERVLGGAETLAIAVRTIGEAAVSGEFEKWPRRLHRRRRWSSILYLVTTVVMVFTYPAAGRRYSCRCWNSGPDALVGGFWFFFFLRVNVVMTARRRCSLHGRPVHRSRCWSASVRAAAGIVAFAQTANAAATWTWVLAGIYFFFTTLLFPPACPGPSSPTCSTSPWWPFLKKGVRRPTVPSHPAGADKVTGD